MVEVIVTDKFEQWYLALNNDDAKSVTFVVDLLEKVGTGLKYPYTSSIKGSRYPLRELRVKSHGQQIRIFYSFDPKRQVVLLIGAIKTGQDRFYEDYVPQAEKLWLEYLSSQKGD
jgi:hypothetical protein